MESVWATELRVYAAPLAAVCGGWLALFGARSVAGALASPVGVSGRALRLMRGFRALIVGTALVCLAAGWFWQLEALAVGAALIGAGELMETSIDVWALRRELDGRRPFTSSPARLRER